MNTLKTRVAAMAAGALIMFVWGAFSHMALLKGEGFSRLPNEQRFVACLRTTFANDGLYFFPGTDLRGTPTPAETADFEARFHAGPTGMIVYHAAGSTPLSPRKLLIQLLSEMLASGIVAYALSMIAGPYWRRVMVVASFGAFSCLSVSALYWNWYGFPTPFFLAQCLDKVGGWLLAGLAIARLVHAPTLQATGR